MRHAFFLGLGLMFAACSGTQKPMPLLGDARKDAPDGNSSSDSISLEISVNGDAFTHADLSQGDTPITVNPPDGDLLISGGEAGNTLVVTSGQPLPTVTFTAGINGQTYGAFWSVDQGELGSINPTTGVFTPSGTLGGVVTVHAQVGNDTATFQLTIKLVVSQNGAPLSSGDAGADVAAVDAAGDSTPVSDAGNGAGGWGGVGGEGLGGPVTGAIQTLFQSAAPTTDASYQLLYPYDGTVWPQGILAPLIQWQTTTSYSAVKIELSCASYDYTGTFAATATPFIHHPIPQDIWTQLGLSCSSQQVTVSLTFTDGTNVFATTPTTWTIARGSLKGTVYYNSYGTNLATNYSAHNNALNTTVNFGAATLAIRGGSTDPTLIAGDNTHCLVCHEVSSNGSSLITQAPANNDGHSVYYDLHSLGSQDLSPSNGAYAFGAIYPDGSLSFANSYWYNNGANSDLYSVPGGFLLSLVPTTTAPTNLKAVSPVFSHDGAHLAFNYYGGSGTGLPAADQASLGMLDFSLIAANGNGDAALESAVVDALADAGVSGATISNLRIQTPTNGKYVWPSFLPTNTGVIVELELRGDNRGAVACAIGSFGETRSECDNTGTCQNNGVWGELWWVDFSQTPAVATRLNALNGKTATGTLYLPTNCNTNHGPQSCTATGSAAPANNAGGDDSVYNYEPTVNPVASGGYAWVVFTSRRLYGNIATINPFWSDPRFTPVDLKAVPTPKKLWVAAIDLNATPGTDPSHPAFYLPAQELMAGNSRGYWVVDPCEADGTSCETGDECCGGYCRSGGDGGALVCSSTKPTCANEFEACSTNDDCCGHGIGVICIGGMCTAKSTTVLPTTTIVVN